MAYPPGVLGWQPRLAGLLLLKLTLLCPLLHAHRPEGLGHPTGENEGGLLDLGRHSKSWLWAASATAGQSWEAKPALRKNKG